MKLKKLSLSWFLNGKTWVRGKKLREAPVPSPDLFSLPPAALREFLFKEKSEEEGSSQG